LASSWTRTRQRVGQNCPCKNACIQNGCDSADSERQMDVSPGKEEPNSRRHHDSPTKDKEKVKADHVTRYSCPLTQCYRAEDDRHEPVEQREPEADAAKVSFRHTSDVHHCTALVGETSRLNSLIRILIEIALFTLVIVPSAKTRLEPRTASGPSSRAMPQFSRPLIQICPCKAH
jgi:hypothetical protein